MKILAHWMDDFRHSFRPNHFLVSIYTLKYCFLPHWLLRTQGLKGSPVYNKQYGDALIYSYIFGKSNETLAMFTRKLVEYGR